jgi:hypothetical protein
MQASNSQTPATVETREGNLTNAYHVSKKVLTNGHTGSARLQIRQSHKDPDKPPKGTHNYRRKDNLVGYWQVTSRSDVRERPRNEMLTDVNSSCVSAAQGHQDNSGEKTGK